MWQSESYITNCFIIIIKVNYVHITYHFLALFTCSSVTFTYKELHTKLSFHLVCYRPPKVNIYYVSIMYIYCAQVWTTM